MQLTDILQQQPLFCWSMIIIFGLCIGSFLNVVIYRLPIMLHHEWLNELRHATYPSLSQVPNTTTNTQSYNLFWPRSACPHCRTPLALKDNIPLLSWIMLQGKCRYCHQTISYRYPIIEALTTLITVLIVYLFCDNTMLLLGGLLLSYWLIALAVIDLNTWQLPDNLTLSLLWLGLLFNLNQHYTALENAVIGAVAGYSILWLLYWLFRICFKKEGLGYGDFKLLAALGAWFGWIALPDLLIIASCTGILIALITLYRTKRFLNNPIPFGPSLAFAGGLYLLYTYSSLIPLPW